MGSIEGQVALVTGSSRGIGKAVAIELSTAGATVVVNYVSNQQAAEEVVNEIKSSGGKAVAVQADVSKVEDAQRLIKETIDQFGKLDILVNNAGINRDRTLRRMSPDEWREVISTNLDSVYNCVSAALPHMSEGGGHIINMSSVIGQMGNLGQANYGATKAGMIGFTKSAAQELARYNITVNAVCPGFISTDMVEALADNIKETLIGRIPVGRFGKPEEVAAVVRFLVTEGDYITGQQININGGLYM